MRVRASIGFTFRGEPVVVADPATARMTVLDWLRGERLGVGTKEGCAEGDCGACTAVLARGIDGRAHVATVNTCILMVGQLDGCTLVTIEDLAGRDGTLHPVQAAMIEQHGAQCGFCTPGIVMSLVALHETGERPLDRSAVLDQLAGNLCRCTGYRPIVAAALAAAAEPPRGDATQAAARAPVADPGADVLVGDDHSFFAAPASEATLQALLDRHPDALILAGATDAGLTLTKALAQPAKVIWLGRVVGLDQIADEGDVLCLGASATLEAAKPRLAAIAPDLGEVMRRFGSLQVRNSGTVGGNIANASPIGDLAPCLIALGARLELASSSGRRELPLEDYFLAYKRQDRHAGEYVSRVRVPRLAAGCHFKAYKISKRRDEDISAVLGAVQIAVDGGRVVAARIAFGGMSGIPARARGCETRLAGARLDDPATWTDAIKALAEDFAPIDDHRASAAYRRLVAANLLRKTLLELAGTPLDDIRLPLSREARNAG